ncbi:MAG: ABC transporter permease [Azospirillaceae bacterium]|nr:ABC transporter permease [Azospirillaceae bacterium]
MVHYLGGRLWQSIVLLLLVSVIGFALLHLAPGGPLSQFTLTPGMTQAQMTHLAAQMGLDRPLPIQYLDWLWHLLQGDWGRSYRDNRPVAQVIFGHLGATLLLMVSGMAISLSIGVYVGIKSAINRGSFFDYMTTVGSMIALSIPTFWFGLIAIYLFSVKLGWLPAGNMYTIGNGSLLDYARHLILPASVLGLVDVATWSRYMRTATLEVIHQDFVRTARAKGLSHGRILRRHVIGNALLPMVTLAGMQLPAMLGGALVAETVFTWPGMGRLFRDSLGYSDYPVVMGLLMFSAILVLVGSLVTDLLAAVIDPRIRLG